MPSTCSSAGLPSASLFAASLAPWQPKAQARAAFGPCTDHNVRPTIASPLMATPRIDSQRELTVVVV
jgi:hypothetical protein